MRKLPTSQDDHHLTIFSQKERNYCVEGKISLPLSLPPFCNSYVQLTVNVSGQNAVKHLKC